MILKNLFIVVIELLLAASAVFFTWNWCVVILPIKGITILPMSIELACELSFKLSCIIIWGYLGVGVILKILKK